MPETVMTRYGPVKGVLKDGITVFKGIPYAAPPVGPARWTAPKPPKPWTEMLDCTDFRSVPVQLFAPWMPAPSYPVSEDCLYLNVWTPAKMPDAALPVVVWFYGGAYKTGSSDNPVTAGDGFAKRGCVFVSFNYRVGAFGFLAHKELKDENGHCGNWGTLDQITALRWVHENIRAFGGDPDKVTILGQSAGAHSVMTMCASPLSKGLFRAAIIESTGGTSGMYLQDEQTIEDAMEEGMTYLSMLGVSTIEEARKLDAQTVAEKLTNAKLSSRAPWFPKTDGYVLPEGTITAILNDHNAKIDYLIGATSWETGKMGGFMGAPTETGIRCFAERVFPNDPDGYMQTVDTSSEERLKESAFNQYENDKVCANLGWQALELYRGGKTAWMYHFTKQVTDFMTGERTGPSHSSELPYVFGTLDTLKFPQEPTDYALSELMMRYWTNFIVTGDPNGEGLPHWERSTDYDEAMELGDRVGMFRIPMTENRKFIINYMLKLAGKA